MSNTRWAISFVIAGALALSGCASGSASVAATSASRSRRKRRRQAFTKFACGAVARWRFAASTARLTSVKGS